AARRVPHRCDRSEQDSGPTVQSQRDHRQGHPHVGDHPMTTPAAPTLSRKDFVTDQDVRWCPGCGDYSILSQVAQHRVTSTAAPTLSRKDFVTDQDVRWCPGCGDYSILAQVQKIMPELGVPKEKIVLLSGIRCSSRCPS